MRSSELATMVNSDPSTVSRQVAQLVERGHVERVPDERNGRAFVLAVTQSGREVAAAIQQRRTESLGPSDRRMGTRRSGRHWLRCRSVSDRLRNHQAGLTRPTRR
ncbi:MAG: MarR family transcriptional regulator [Mycobacterium sp.]|nr:MarR family transcriptional regulator [Mycobacterium sp.]